MKTYHSVQIWGQTAMVGTFLDNPIGAQVGGKTSWASRTLSIRKSNTVLGQVNTFLFGMMVGWGINH